MQILKVNFFIINVILLSDLSHTKSLKPKYKYKYCQSFIKYGGVKLFVYLTIVLVVLEKVINLRFKTKFHR